jgi:hypothetical protein
MLTPVEVVELAAALPKLCVSVRHWGAPTGKERTSSSGKSLG